MTIYETIKNRLEVDTDFRERRFRKNGLCELVLEKHNKLGVMFVDSSFLITFAEDYETYRRTWTLVLNNHPELQGSDWKDKSVLEQEKQISLGYESGFNQKLHV